MARGVRIPSIAILLSIRLLPSSLLSRFSDYLINSIKGTFGFLFLFLRKEESWKMHKSCHSRRRGRATPGMRRKNRGSRSFAQREVDESTLIHFVGFSR
jgi:hypothetical protein